MPEVKERGSRYWLAIVLVAGFVLFCVALAIAAPSASENTWNRWIFLFGAIEAVGFTAVGWLYGAEVHRGKAAQAQADADRARDEAEEARLETQKSTAWAADLERRGFALAETVRGISRVGASLVRDDDEELLAGSDDDGVRVAGRASAVTSGLLIDVADRLFPPDGAPSESTLPTELP
jgi:hypothetical protein